MFSSSFSLLLRIKKVAKGTQHSHFYLSHIVFACVCVLSAAPRTIKYTQGMNVLRHYWTIGDQSRLLIVTRYLSAYNDFSS